MLSYVEHELKLENVDVEECVKAIISALSINRENIIGDRRLYNLAFDVVERELIVNFESKLISYILKNQVDIDGLNKVINDKILAIRENGEINQNDYHFLESLVSKKVKDNPNTHLVYDDVILTIMKCNNKSISDNFNRKVSDLKKKLKQSKANLNGYRDHIVLALEDAKEKAKDYTEEISKYKRKGRKRIISLVVTAGLILGFTVVFDKMAKDYSTTVVYETEIESYIIEDGVVSKPTLRHENLEIIDENLVGVLNRYSEEFSTTSGMARYLEKFKIQRINGYEYEDYINNGFKNLERISGNVVTDNKVIVTTKERRNGFSNSDSQIVIDFYNNQDMEKSEEYLNKVEYHSGKLVIGFADFVFLLLGIAMAIEYKPNKEKLETSYSDYLDEYEYAEGWFVDMLEEIKSNKHLQEEFNKLISLSNIVKINPDDKKAMDTLIEGSNNFINEYKGLKAETLSLKRKVEGYKI